MEEIEENREEALAYLQKWVEEVRQSLLSLIVEGDGRSKAAGMYMENDLGWLKICLEGVREDILEEAGSNQKLQWLYRTVILMKRVEFLTSIVRENLKEIQEEEVTVDEEFQTPAAIEGQIETSTEDIEGETGFVTDGSKKSLYGGDVIQICDSTREETNEKVGLKMEEEKIKVVDNGDFWLRREEIAMEFEKMMTIATSKVQSTDAVWILGLREDQKFEPVFLLVKGTSEIGTGKNMEHLGPPPWAKPKDEIGAKQWNRASQESAMADKKVSWNILELGQVVDERMLMVARVLTSKTGLSWEKQIRSSQLGRERVSTDSFVPDIEILGPPPWPNTFNNHGLNSLQIMPKVKQAEECLLRSDLLDSQTPRVPSRSFESPPPPNKPPPQPPDFPSDLSRLGFIHTISAFHATSSPMSFQISSKVDAAGDDPGDGRSHQIPVSGVYELASRTSLGDKACLKTSTSALIIGKEGYHGVDCSFALPVPPEPPPQPPSVQLWAPFVRIHAKSTDWTLLQLRGRKDTASIDPGDTLARRCPGVFAFGCATAFNYTLEDKVYAIKDAMSVYLEFKLMGEDVMQLAGKFTMLGQLVYVIVRSLCKHGDKLLMGENHRVLALFCHSPRPPEFANVGEVPLNFGIRYKWLIGEKGDNWLSEDISLEAQVEIEFQMLTELLHLTSSWEGGIEFQMLTGFLNLTSSWEGCISHGQWELKLNLVNASVGFRISFIRQKVRIKLWALNHNICILVDAKVVLNWNLPVQV